MAEKYNMNPLAKYAENLLSPTNARPNIVVKTVLSEDIKPKSIKLPKNTFRSKMLCSNSKSQTLGFTTKLGAKKLHLSS